MDLIKKSWNACWDIPPRSTAKNYYYYYFENSTGVIFSLTGIIMNFYINFDIALASMLRSSQIRWYNEIISVIFILDSRKPCVIVINDVLLFIFRNRSSHDHIPSKSSVLTDFTSHTHYDLSRCFLYNFALRFPSKQGYIYKFSSVFGRLKKHFECCKNAVRHMRTICF